jgi:DNA-binding NarL/FixJ family response regulator
MVKNIRVFLMDDHEVVRRGLKEMLNSEGSFQVVGEATGAEESLSRLPDLHPDVALLDLRIPDGDGIEVCREIRSNYPQVACLILTSFDDDEALLSAAIAGASGYVLKQIHGTELFEAIKQAALGKSLLDANIVAKVVERLKTSSATDEKLRSLSPQEKRILDFIAQGLTNRQIGEQMYLAEKTVKNYVSNVLSKLGMSRRTEAAVYAAQIAERKRFHS